MNNRELTRERAQNMLFYDKLGSPSNFKVALKLELYSVLQNFMEIKEDDINLNIIVQKDGAYIIELAAKTNRIKPIGYVLK